MSKLIDRFIRAPNAQDACAHSDDYVGRSRGSCSHTRPDRAAGAVFKVRSSHRSPPSPTKHSVMTTQFSRGAAGLVYVWLLMLGGLLTPSGCARVQEPKRDPYYTPYGALTTEIGRAHV